MTYLQKSLFESNSYDMTRLFLQMLAIRRCRVLPELLIQVDFHRDSTRKKSGSQASVDFGTCRSQNSFDRSGRVTPKFGQLGA